MVDDRSPLEGCHESPSIIELGSFLTIYFELRKPRHRALLPRHNANALSGGEELSHERGANVSRSACDHDHDCAPNSALIYYTASIASLPAICCRTRGRG